MSNNENLRGLSILGLVGVLLYAARKTGQGYKYGGFNDGDELPLVPVREMSAQIALLAQRQGQGDLWLGETTALAGYTPEYLVVLDLVDDTKVQSLDDFQTPITRPYTAGNIGMPPAPDMRGVLKHEIVGGIKSKSAFFRAVEGISSVIWKDGVVLDMVEPGLTVGANSPRTQIVPSRGGGSTSRYRLNLVALPAQRGMMLPPPLPFSPLFMTFEVYGDLGVAQIAYRQALEYLKNNTNPNVRVAMMMRGNRRRLR